MSATNALVSTNNNNKPKKNNNNTQVINFSNKGAAVTMNGKLSNNKGKIGNASANKTTTNTVAAVTMNGKLSNNKGKIGNASANKTTTMNGQNGRLPTTTNNGAAVGNGRSNNNPQGSFGPAVITPKLNNKPKNTKNPFGLVFNSNGEPNTINNPLFKANVKKYRPINNLFTATSNKTSGITLNLKNNRPFGYVIPMSAVKNNPNMNALVKIAGYKIKNNHFVHPLVGNSPNSLFVNNAPLPNNPQVKPPAAANINQNNRNRLKNYLKKCDELKNEYKSLLQRMKDINCNMNGIAQ